MADLTFRLAEPSDWPAIYSIFNRVTDGGDTYPYPPGLSEDEAKIIWLAPSHTVYVAQMGEEITGTAYVKPNMPGLGDHVCNAGWMIHPDHQGQGIGRSFAEYVIGEASESFRAMQFNAVVSANTPAVRLWASLGFEIGGGGPPTLSFCETNVDSVDL